MGYKAQCKLPSQPLAFLSCSFFPVHLPSHSARLVHLCLICKSLQAMAAGFTLAAIDC